MIDREALTAFLLNTVKAWCRAEIDLPGWPRLTGKRPGWPA